MKTFIENYIRENKLVQLVNVFDKRKVINGIHPTATVREIAKNEVVIEFDSDSKRRVQTFMRETIKKLFHDKLFFVVYSHKGKSPHIHIYNIDGLNSIDGEIVSAYKKMMIEKYAPYKETDRSLVTKNSLIAYEGRPHFKHKNIKQLLLINAPNGFSNVLNIDLLNKAYDYVKHFKKDYNNDDCGYDNSWLVNWLINEKDLPIGGIDNILCKNVAIVMANQKIKFEITNPLMYNGNPRRINQIRGWFNWANGTNKKVRIGEVLKYFDRHNINMSEVRQKWSLG